MFNFRAYGLQDSLGRDLCQWKCIWQLECWRKPVIVTADAMVQNGTAFVIDPNVEVRFAQNPSLFMAL